MSNLDTERYQLFEPLRSEEYQALTEDIRKRGVLVPVEVDEQGAILDGHHRMRIADSLGIECPVVVRSFDFEADKVEHVLKINLLRRHMGPVSWAKAFERLAEQRGVELGKQGRHNEKSATVADLSQELGVPVRTARHRLDTARKLESHPDLAEKVDTGEMHAKRALRVVRERAAEKRAKEEPAPTLPAAIDIRECSVESLEVDEGSVDLIFTDPPYPKEYLDCWDHLTKFANHALRDGGLLIAYSGQFHLVDVLNALAADLNYVWLGSLVLNGPHNNIQGLRIRNRVKPLLFFSKGRYRGETWIDDCFDSESRSKEHHEWEQSTGAALHYIERLTKPGDLVVDPFLGSGTTALACKELKRRFIGCDVDPVAIDTAKRRLA